MNRLHVIAGLVQVEWDTDDQGVTSADPLLPPIKEIWIGGAASLIVFVALWKYALPPMKQALRDRTARIQGELDAAAAGTTEAEQNATQIRTALGDIDGERQRLFAEAEQQAEAILTDGRTRLDAEIAELHAPPGPTSRRPPLVAATNCAPRSAATPLGASTPWSPARSTTRRSRN